MERLTHDVIYTFDNHLEDIERQWVVKVQKKLREYEDAEEQGLIVKLPCKVGDTVYEINEGRIMEYSLGRNWRILRLLEEGFFGIKVFTTREEAEQILAKENEHDGE